MTFSPRLVSKMWGGRNLGSVLGKTPPDERPYGESWEIFDFPPGSVGADGMSPGDKPDDWISAKVTHGPLAGNSLHQILQNFPQELLGSSKPAQTQHGIQFPLLVKFLDARQDLSVQVHPDDAYAKAHPNAFVKNECWYVMARDAGARLLIATKPGVTKEAFARSLTDGTCESMMNAIPVEVGQTYYLPSGTVHALGAGVLAAEVQTPSDTTYRVFDFDRVEPATGKKRSLHVEQAMACIDFASQSPARPVDVVRAPQFTMHVVDNPAHIDTQGKATVVVCASGRLTLGGVELSKGQSVLLPAVLGKVAVQTDAHQSARLLVAHAM